MGVTDFADNGQKGTYKNFFKNASQQYPDLTFMDIYTALTPVLAKQYVNIPSTPDNPLTQKFLGEAINYGAVIEDIYIDPINMDATKSKPTADETLGFYDVDMRKQYSTINAMNTGAVSRYTREIRKASMDGDVAQKLADSIIQDLRVGQIACVENQANKVLVSSIKDEVYCDVPEGSAPAEAIRLERAKIIDTAIEMSKVNGTYTQTGYDGIGARDVCIIATKNKWAQLTLDNSGVYHPEFLMFDQFKKFGVNITPIAVDKFEAPVTTDEVTAYTTPDRQKWDKPAGLDKKMPDYVICDSLYFRINPFVDEYTMDTQHVGSGLAYDTFFLHIQNAFSYQENRKAVRVYTGSSA